VDNELRVQHLAACVKKGRQPDPRIMRDPGVFMAAELARLETQRRQGHIAEKADAKRAYFPYTMMGRLRLDHLSRALDAIRAEAVGGDLVECGTGRGGGGIFLRGYLAARGIEDRAVWIADPFVAPPESRAAARRVSPLTADLRTVRMGFHRFGLLDERVRFLQGRLPDAVQDAPIDAIALLRLGEGLGKSVDATLEALYAKVAIGGFVLVEHAGVPAAREAVDAFRARHGIEEPVERIDPGATAWRKLEQRAAARARPAAELWRVPAAPPAPDDAIDPASSSSSTTCAGPGRGRCTRCRAATRRASRTSTSR